MRFGHQQKSDLQVAMEHLRSDNRALYKSVEALQEENARLNQWVKDLQSGMYINCVYCGHRFGPKDSTPVAMDELLWEHIKTCPKHPGNIVNAKIEKLRQAWLEYKAYLKEKYPAEEGKEWEFTCPHHQAIDQELKD